MSNKKKLTYSIDENISKEFKVECVYQGVEMSSTIESFMVSFSKASKQSRANNNE